MANTKNEKNPQSTEEIKGMTLLLEMESAEILSLNNLRIHHHNRNCYSFCRSITVLCHSIKFV